MKKLSYFILILALSIGATLSAQQQKPYIIEGTVLDETGVLPGVTVIVKGQFGGTVTDNNGKFSIKASRGEWLIFTYMGYETYEYLVNEEMKNLQITLKESTQQVEEIVITGVGAQRKISNLAAVTTVDIKDLQVPAPSIVNMLGGRVAGIFTMQASGEPGKNLAEFWVRGIGTFGAGQGALVLIDGLEGDINSIDPADIESFSVLKDASATAVYGVRGANGVVLITTKRGESGKLNIVGRYNYSISHLQRLPKYLRAYDYAGLVNEAYEIRGENPRYSDIQMEIIKDGLDPDYFPDVDWQGEIVNPFSFKQTYYASGSGGGDVARYFVSLGTSNETAAYKVEKNNPYASNAGYKTYSFRINLDINLSKTTTLKFMSDAFMSNNNRPGDISSTDYIWQSQAYLTPLMFPIRYSNGLFPSANATSGMSPYVMINQTGNTQLHTYTSMFSMTLEQDLKFITKGLKFKILGAYDRNGGYNESRYRRPALYRVQQQRNNRGELVAREIVAATTNQLYSIFDETQFRKYQFETTLNYDRVFANDHRIGGLAYFFLSDQQSTTQMNENENQGMNLSYAMIPRRYERMTGRVAYGFRDTYMVDFNFGYTGTENFMPGRQFGFFPSVALGWVPTSYEFVKNKLPWLSFLKFRASYGSVGNDRIGGRRFPYLNWITAGRANVWGSPATRETVNVNIVGADNLVWEKALKGNIGVDGHIFKESIQFTVDFFRDLRNGIFQPRVNVPDYAGLTNMPYGNVGSMVSWGSDGNASYAFKLTQDIDVTLRGNFTYSKNKVINYEKMNELYPYKEKTGLPWDVVYGYQCLGFFKDEDDVKYSARQTWSSVKPGDLKYKDMNGDGVINVEDQVPIAYKSMFPILMYGFGGQVSYKQLSVGFLFKGTGQIDYFRNNTGYIPFNNGEQGNILKEFGDPSTRWIPKWYVEEHGMDPSLAENPNAKIPRLQYGGNANNQQLSDFWKGDARYLRLQEVTINYNLKKNFLKKLGISSVDLQLVGNNLYLWDKVKVFDPEQADKVGTVYPIPSIYSFQLYIHL